MSPTDRSTAARRAAWDRLWRLLLTADDDAELNEPVAVHHLLEQGEEGPGQPPLQAQVARITSRTPAAEV